MPHDPSDLGLIWAVQKRKAKSVFGFRNPLLDFEICLHSQLKTTLNFLTSHTTYSSVVQDSRATRCYLFHTVNTMNYFRFGIRKKIIFARNSASDVVSGRPGLR